jgi:Acyclic terpene utilisation family protein AtuA
MTASFRIASGAGYSGDRIDPALALAESGRIDALVFECLAERTIALAQLRRSRDPGHGYDPLLEARMRAVLPACVRDGITVLTNMGAAHPRAAGAAVVRVARELGLKLRVAVVEGDDVLDWVTANDPPLMEGPDGARASDLGPLLSANAYLGADALLPALASGANVIVSGRVSDPALFLAPLMHAFGWRADDWERLGQGTLVGHLLECAAQVSGGYIADPGRFDVPALHDVGFPLAEVQADGSAVITKLPGTGGRIDRLTCTAQLLYEIGDPARYLQPDVVADFSRVRFTEPGPDRVRAEGAGGSARPEMLKATLGWRDGWIGEGQISYAGPGAVERGKLALQVLVHRLERQGLQHLERRAELIGVDAMHGPQHGSDRLPYEVRLRLAVRCPTRDDAERIGQEVEALYLNGPAGGGGVTQAVREVIAAASVRVPRTAVRASVTLLEA